MATIFWRPQRLALGFGALFTCRRKTSVPIGGTHLRAQTFNDLLRCHESGELMPRSHAVSKYLPFLRRYARALTGTQSSGDTYVTLTLEALPANPNLLSDGVNVRVALFRLFTRIWRSAWVEAYAEAAAESGWPEQRLANLTPLARQAFLLMAMEGFCEEDAAHILECDSAGLRQLVERAGRELSPEIATDVLVIEDEVLVAMDLEALFANLGHKMIGVARTHAEALKLAKVKQPGLIVSDIQLADGSSGLEAVNELLRGFDAPVLFITGYPERFLTGERPEPAFLISKPFQPAQVSAIASQALLFERKAKRRLREPATAA
jgi:CheY-like chemotaxis protein